MNSKQNRSTRFPDYSIVHSNTDISRLAFLGVPLLIAEWFLGGGEISIAFYEACPKAVVCLLYPLVGLLAIALGMIAASVSAMMMDKVKVGFPLRKQLEAILVAGCYIFGLYVSYRLIYVELVGATPVLFSEKPWLATKILLYRLMEGYPLARVAGYEGLKGFLASRLFGFVLAAGYMVWSVDKGRDTTTIVSKIEDIQAAHALVKRERELLEEERQEAEAARPKESEKPSLSRRHAFLRFLLDVMEEDLYEDDEDEDDFEDFDPTDIDDLTHLFR